MYSGAGPRRSDAFFGMHLVAHAGIAGLGEGDGARLGAVTGAVGEDTDCR
jgi:hypothetical protein